MYCMERATMTERSEVLKTLRNDGRRELEAAPIVATIAVALNSGGTPNICMDRAMLAGTAHFSRLNTY